MCQLPRCTEDDYTRPFTPSLEPESEKIQVLSLAFLRFRVGGLTKDEAISHLDLVCILGGLFHRWTTFVDSEKKARYSAAEKRNALAREVEAKARADKLRREAWARKIIGRQASATTRTNGDNGAHAVARSSSGVASRVCLLYTSPSPRDS